MNASICQSQQMFPSNSSSTTHRPEQVLVADKEPHDISRLLCLSLLCALGQSAWNGLMEEQVGSHDGGDGPQVHPVPFLSGNHLTEELEEGLKDGDTSLNISTFKWEWVGFRLHRTCFHAEVEQVSSQRSTFRWFVLKWLLRHETAAESLQRNMFMHSKFLLE